MELISVFILTAWRSTWVHPKGCIVILMVATGFIDSCWGLSFVTGYWLQNKGGLHFIS